MRKLNQNTVVRLCSRMFNSVIVHFLISSVGSNIQLDKFGQRLRTTAAAANLLGDGRELHDVQRLVVGGGALVDVDNHGRSAAATEDGLEEFGQLALSEWYVAALGSDGQTDTKHC